MKTSRLRLRLLLLTLLLFLAFMALTLTLSGFGMFQALSFSARQHFEQSLQTVRFWLDTQYPGDWSENQGALLKGGKPVPSVDQVLPLLKPYLSNTPIVFRWGLGDPQKVAPPIDLPPELSMAEITSGFYTVDGVVLPLKNGEQVVGWIRAQGDVSGLPEFAKRSMVIPVVGIIVFFLLSAGLLVWLFSFLYKPVDVLATENTSFMEKNKQLMSVSHTDALTGLLNRRGLEDRLPLLSWPRECWLAMVDADHFKSINDTYGHNGGDDVLKHLSSHIQRLFRQTDLCVRWGGEEFLVVLAGGDASQARAVVERFRHSIENNPHEGNGQKIAYTVTVGLASFVPGHFSLALEQADQALYHGKKTGRNRVVSFWEL